jgi:ComEC/Rec2-related protein
MFVWWAVYFFAGAFFPSGAASAASALCTISILVSYTWRFPPALRSRALLTCASGLFVLVTASLTPIDKDLLSGSTRPVVFRKADHASPVTAVRERVLTIIDKGELSAETRGLLKALLIADRTALSRKARRDWRNTGTAHYLALSGLHLGLIAVPLFGILTLAGTRGILRDFTALFALSFYAAVAGRPGSLLRALSMMAVMRTHRLSGVSIGLARCVVTGAFLVCILDPHSLNDTGFMLSFNAAAGVALLGVPLCRSIQHRIVGRRGSRIILPPLLALAMSLSVQASMLPLLVRIFGFAPLPGPVMSVVMALPVTALLYGGFIYIIAGHTWSSITSIPLNLLSTFTGELVSRGAEISRAGLVISDFDVRLYVPGLVLCAVAFMCKKHGKAIFIFGMAMSIFSFLPVIAGRDYIERGTVSFPGHGGILYGGNGGVLVLEQWPEAWSAPYVAREVRRSGARSIDVLVILDPGDFEAEGMSILADDLDPERILVSPWYDGPYPWKAECIAVRADTILKAGNMLLQVRAPAFLPGRGVHADRNDASLVISPLD